MQNLKTYTIYFTDISKLKECFLVSAELSENSIINFSINKEGLFGIAKNETDSCYKTWKIDFDGKTFMKKSDPEEELKCSIFKGKDFISKVLNHFDKSGHLTSITFSYDELSGSVKMFKTELMNIETKKVSLKFNIVTANTNIHFDEFDEELISMLFNSDDENVKIVKKFLLSSEELKDLKSYINYQTNDELQENFISFKFKEDGTLFVTDNVFQINYNDKGIESFDDKSRSLDFQKILFKTISIRNSVEVIVKDFDGNSVMTFININDENARTSFLLLKQLDMSQNYEDIFNDTSTFD